MTELLRKEDVEVDALREQAQRAVAVFRRLQPTLTSYARVLSKNPKARVELASHDNGSTDGTRIFYRPPIALGDNTPHERRICNDRGPDGIMLCKACAIREEVLVTIYHEIFHLAFDSFARIDDNDKRNTIEFALKEISGPWAERVRERIKNEWDIRSYMALARTLNPYLPHIVNGLEDARVNTAGFEVHVGLRKMFAADEARIFNKGFEVKSADGSIKLVKWNEEPLNSQMLIGIYSKALGYDYSNWFHEKVVESLNDSELTALLAGMRTIRSASAVYNLSLKVLSRLREMGYLATETDPEPPPPQQPEEPKDADESDPDTGDSDDREGEASDSGDSKPEDLPDGSVSPEVSGDQDDSEGSDDSDSDDSEAGGDSSQPGDEGDSDDSSGQAHGDSDALPHDPQPGEASDGEPSDGTPDSEPEAGSSSGDESEPGDGSRDVAGGDETSPIEDGDTGSTGDARGGLRSGDIEAPEESSPSGDGDSSGDRDSAMSPDPSETTEAAPQGNSSGDLDSEPIDTGADDGYGGTDVISSERDDSADPPYGSPEDLNVPQVLEWMGHAEKPKTLEAEVTDKAMETAVVQGIYFNKPSVNIRGVKEYHYDKPPTDPGEKKYYAWSTARRNRTLGTISDLEVPEAILQPALLRTRRVFSDNRRGRNERNRRSGHVNAKSLGKRAPLGDDRLFAKRYLPGIKDYEVIIGGDISGSTVGVNLALEKRAIMAQAELLDRVGIPFSIYCHTGSPKGDGRHQDQDLDIYMVKERHDKWDSKTKERLINIGSAAYNLDGHAMEYLRKRAEESQATDKIILYYSDGKMPAENHNEELEILQREINYCRRQGITLLGVGIRTDSPARHGLETVQVTTDEDIPKVIQLLGKRLEQKQ